MSLIAKDSIKVIAESNGIVNLSDEVASTLAPDAEFHIREMIQEAMKFMHHSKRSIITTEDINNALRLRNVEILYGYTNKDPLNFVRAGKDLFFLEDRELEFKEIIDAPLPKVPRDTTLSAHWLAIEGIQPQIPQNPSPAQVENVLSQKKKSKTGTKQVKVKPLVKHLLSKELQDYYEVVTKIIKSSEDEELVDATIFKLGNGAGIQQLLPYLVQYISDQMAESLHKLKILERLIRIVNALVDSSYYHIEPYLHQLMPPLLTCMLGKKLGDNSNEDHFHLREFAALSAGRICKRYGGSYQNLEGRIGKTLLKCFLDPTKPLSSQYGAILGITALGPQKVQDIILPHISAYLKLLEPDLSGTSNVVRQNQARHCRGALLKAAGCYVHWISSTFVEKNEQGRKQSKEEMKSLLPSVSSYYQELQEIFGDSLLPYIAVDNQPVQATI